jgi:hypothetical protein
MFYFLKNLFFPAKETIENKPQPTKQISEI